MEASKVEAEASEASKERNFSDQEEPDALIERASACKRCASASRAGALAEALADVRARERSRLLRLRGSDRPGLLARSAIPDAKRYDSLTEADVSNVGAFRRADFRMCAHTQVQLPACERACVVIAEC